MVDLALDPRPGMPATASVAGPTFALEELAGRKLIALFDRAAGRDFVDVFSLAWLFGKPALVARAAMIDLDFDTQVLAAMVDHLDAYSDVDLLLDLHITNIFRAARLLRSLGGRASGRLSGQQVLAALAAG